MRWKAFGIVTAAVLALPFTALADNPPAAHAHGLFLAGSIVSADSGHVTVDVLLTGKNDTHFDGTQVSIAITSATTIDYGKGQTSIDPGDLVGIHATAADASLSTLTARKIHVACNCHWAAGMLTAISPGLIRVNVKRTGPYDTVLNGNEVKFGLDSTTKFVEGKDKKAISISDLSVGDTVGSRSSRRASSGTRTSSGRTRPSPRSSCTCAATEPRPRRGAPSPRRRSPAPALPGSPAPARAASTRSR
jgi:hypothetical protein